MAYGNINKTTEDINRLLDDYQKKLDRVPNGTLSEENFTEKDKQNLDDSACEIVDHSTGDAVFEITPNKLHKWGEMASLNITLAAPTNPNKRNEYMFTFVSGTQPTSLSLPQEVKWLGPSNIEANKTYEVSIVGNLAVMGGAS